MKEIVDILETKGVKATANRQLVMRAIVERRRPLSLGELELMLAPMDKSSISRVLKLFAERHVVHGVDDGSGVQKYELCHGGDRCTRDETHMHFHCEGCGETFCFESVHVPYVELPGGFLASSASFIMKGLCPACAEKASRKAALHHILT